MEKEARKTIEKKLGLVLLNELKKENIKAAENIAKHIKDAVKTIARKFAKEVKAGQKPSKTPPKAIIAKPVTLDEMKKGFDIVTKVKAKAKSVATRSTKKPAAKKVTKKPVEKKAGKKSPAAAKPKSVKAIKKPVAKINSAVKETK